MCDLLRPCRHAAAIAPMAALLLISAVPGLGQNAAPPATATDQPACAALSGKDIPLGATIRAKTAGGLNAAHMKAGKKFWINVASGVVFPSCTLDNDAAIYGEVIESSAVKSPPSSELAVKFDQVDCTGKGKKEMKMWLVGVMAPPDEQRHVNNEAPSKLSGGARQVDMTAASTSEFDKLNPGGAPNTIKPGAVVGINGLTLEPQGGPSCSAKLTSTTKNVELTPGTMLLLAVGAGQ